MHLLGEHFDIADDGGRQVSQNVLIQNPAISTKKRNLRIITRCPVYPPQTLNFEPKFDTKSNLFANMFTTRPNRAEPQTWQFSGESHHQFRKNVHFTQESYR